MIHILQDNDKYNISFPYDPDVIDLVKAVPGRSWDPNRKQWSIPLDKLGFLLNQLKGTVYEQMVNLISDEKINVDEAIDPTTSIPEIDLSNYQFQVKEGSQPFSHQLDFMKYAVYREQHKNFHGFLLADEMGTGKTLQVANLAYYNKQNYNFKHCLIICCINSGKYNWKRDIEDHFNGREQPYILGTRRRRDKSLRYDGSSVEKLDDLINGTMYGDPKGDPLPYFLILNIEALRYSANRQYLITNRIIQMIHSHELQMIAVDEIHKNASLKSKQGKQLLKIKTSTLANCMWIPMTGTPITNKPTDLFLPLRLIDTHSSNSYYNWCQNFCVYGGYGDHDIIGYKNIDQLKTMLHGNMLRRLKSQVLDLPPKMKYTEYVENTEYQHKLYDKVKRDMLAHEDEIIHDMNPAVKFLRLRQVNGSPELLDEKLVVDKNYLKYNAKLARLLELLQEAHQRGEKVVVYSNWVQTLKTLYYFVSQYYKTCCFTGTMSSEKREKNKRVFQNNPEYTVLLGTIGAAGTSHTFTAATTAIFYDEPWTPSDKVQAEDRIHRAGTTEPVRIITLITQDTVDDKVHEIVYTKEGISSYIVDNKLDIRNHPELFKKLLGE